jgi:hypothetical protein
MNLEKLIVAFLKDYFIVLRKDMYDNVIGGYEFCSERGIGGHLNSVAFEYLIDKLGRDKLEKISLEIKEYETFLYSEKSECSNMQKLIDEKIDEKMNEIALRTLTEI